MPEKRVTQTKRNPTVALCYVRLSWTRDAKDRESPERQRANILRVCEQNGWTAEFYEDTDGHKSGTTEKNRPGWLALKARLGDPDIAALVANDLSRLHRKGWRVGDLLDFVDAHDINLVLAAPGKQIDFSTPLGRLFVQVAALFDEWYAHDIGQRARESIQHRKRQGKTVGMPPFGTTRNSEGFLIPTEVGVWLLRDGSHVKGNANVPPERDAIWRGYRDAALRVLQLYATGKTSLAKVAAQMRREGWSYRNRKGDPIPFDVSAVRRIVANWPEYGGNVTAVRAKERHPERFPIESYQLNPDRAIFPVDLLYRVGRVRSARAKAPVLDNGRNTDAYPYPLLGLLYCHHCDLRATEENEPSRRTQLGGKNRNAVGTYRHRVGVSCPCKRKSIRRDVLEPQFDRILARLSVRPVDLSSRAGAALAQHTQTAQGFGERLDAEKRVAVAKCYRRIEAARLLFEDGDMTYDDYQQRKRLNEREIASLQAQPEGEVEPPIDMATIHGMIASTGLVWSSFGDQDKQAIARILVEELIVDLDAQAIVRVTLTTSAESLFEVATLDRPART